MAAVNKPQTWFKTIHIYSFTVLQIKRWKAGETVSLGRQWGICWVVLPLEALGRFRSFPPPSWGWGVLPAFLGLWLYRSHLQSCILKSPSAPSHIAHLLYGNKISLSFPLLASHRNLKTLNSWKDTFFFSPLYFFPNKVVFSVCKDLLLFSR